MSPSQQSSRFCVSSLYPEEEESGAKNKVEVLSETAFKGLTHLLGFKTLRNGTKWHFILNPCFGCEFHDELKEHRFFSLE